MSYVLKTFVDDTGKQVVSGRELYKALGIRQDFTSWIKKLVGYGFAEGDDYQLLVSNKGLPCGGRPRHDYILSLNMTREICSIVRSPRAVDVGKQLGIDVYNRIVGCKEGQTIEAIIHAFRGELMISQYTPKGLSYHIDLYFPKYKIAVECDEGGHQDYGADKEVVREKEIKQALDCTFIRYNPDSKSFSIFDVINRIYKLIVSAK